MIHKKLLSTLLLGAALFAASSASAIIIEPTFTTFGKLGVATFGGDGIPNDFVAITQVGDVTIGLTATQRYGNATVTNDGKGTFFATAGNDAANGQSAYARWNFDLYISGLAANQFARLYWDANPSVQTDVTKFYQLPNYQESWNLGMGFLGGTTFDPAANGEYGFSLKVFNNDQREAIATTGILVKVSGGSSVPDASSTLGLMGVALIGLAAVSRRRRS